MHSLDENFARFTTQDLDSALYFPKCYLFLQLPKVHKLCFFLFDSNCDQHCILRKVFNVSNAIIPEPFTKETPSYIAVNLLLFYLIIIFSLASQDQNMKCQEN